MSNWKKFTGTFDGNDFFLLRKAGIDEQRTGRFWLPVVAQLIDGDLYSIDNELEALSWANFDSEGFCYEERNPFKANLEWCPIPE
jgi:hypothetical protein